MPFTSLRSVIRIVALLAAAVVIMFAIFQLMNMRSYQLFGQLISRVETDNKKVALTFDDGPTKHADAVLALLDSYKVKATFFLIGSDLENNLGDGQKIAQAGHQIGNHTYSHKRMVFKSPSFIRNEIEKTNQLIRVIGYTEAIDFRPPYGKKLVGLPYYLMKMGIETVTWDIEPDTYHSQAVDKVEYVKNHVKPGSIILMHPMYDTTGEELKAIEGIIQSLLKDGYTFVTVDELQKLEKR